MAEIAARAKGVYAAIQLLDYAELTDSQRDQEKCGVIEQALLAERRLAMEEAAKIAEATPNHSQQQIGPRSFSVRYATPDTTKADIAQALRAAAAGGK